MRLQQGQQLVGQNRKEVFEVLEFLGEGRTAEVYKVRDFGEDDDRAEFRVQMKALFGQLSEDSTYALKIARAESDEDVARLNAQIRREGWALNHMPHDLPGVLATLASDGAYQGRAFFTMPLLDGPKLGEHLSGKRLRYRELIQLLLPVAEAVAECHRLEYIHRDIRPSNIIVDAELGPVLFDFESCELRVRPESSTLAVGFAEFAAPEYLACVLDPEVAYIIHPRADVYALGVMLYSMLTGRLPVRRTAKTLASYLEELRDATPAHVLEMNPDAPPALAALAMRLLAKAEDRIPDAQGLPELLEEALRTDESPGFQLAPALEASMETPLSSFMPRTKPHALRRLWARADRFMGPQGRAVAFISMLLVAGGAAVHGHDLAARAETLARTNDNLASAVAGLVIGGLPWPYGSPAIGSNLGERKVRLMPHEPLPNQGATPCRGIAQAFYGSCWILVGNTKAPCPPDTFQEGDSCYVPAVADSRNPVGEPPLSSNPEKR